MIVYMSRLMEGSRINGVMSLSSWNKFELRVYGLLGVQQFRKAILLLEKIKHRKDKRKNENYHPSSFNVFALEQYNGFLLYNAFLHAVSLFFTVVYAAVSTTIEFRNVVLDLGMIALTILNVYCIILQRANYLILKEFRYKYYMRFLNRTDLCRKETLEKIYALEPQKLQTDYEVLSRLRKAFEGQADCILTSADSESLKRICACFESPSINKVNRKNKEILEVGLIEKCYSASGPYTALQARADSLQRKLCLPGRKMLDRTVIITENAECEMLYRKLFPEDTIYNFCLVCFFLYEVFTGMIGKVDKNAG